MLAHRNPHDAYRRVEFDARIASARGEQLVGLCYEELSMALGSAIRANELGDNQRRSQGLTRALSALTALQLGIDADAQGAAALRQFYGGLRQAVLGSVPNFDPARLSMVKTDIDDVAAVLTGTRIHSILE
ncbi:MAG: hypothetical protein RL671_1115 [Pseudomonadota bacterium]|jgi:flagellar protein FliS